MRRLLPIIALLLTGVLYAEPVTIPAAEAGVQTEGAALGNGVWNLWSNGQVGQWCRVVEPGEVTLVVRAYGRPAVGRPPRAALRIETWTGARRREVDVVNTEADGLREYRFTADMPAGPGLLGIAFLNDYFDAEADEDRNLYVHSLTISGATPMAEPPSVKKLTDRAIREHRMGTLVVETKPNAKVKVRQLRHEFRFGTAVATHLFTDRADEGARQQFRRILADNFNAIVFENAFKWPQYEPGPGEPDPTVVERMLEFAEAHDLFVRGHCLFWANGKRVPDWAKELDDAGLRKAIDRRVRRDVARYAGRIDEYDVNNEMLDHRYFSQRLGSDIRVHMFKLAHEIDPTAPMYLNDYGVLAGGKLNRYERQIQWFLDQGAPVGGIGCQGHFGRGVAPFLTMKHVLDRLAKFDLPITVTEFDVTAPTEAQKATDLEKFYRVCFAHPAVDGILMWGFWDKAHWRPKAALWRGEDFEPTPAAHAYRRLLFEEWWTEFEGKADRSGRCEVPAFFGTHRVEMDGKTIDVDLRRADGERTVRLMD